MSSRIVTVEQGVEPVNAGMMPLDGGPDGRP